MKMTRPAMRKLLESQSVKPWPMPKGTRGGHRYSLAEVMRAWQRDTTDRADRLRKGWPEPSAADLEKLRTLNG
jgi:hypothetical protein